MSFSLVTNRASFCRCDCFCVFKSYFLLVADISDPNAVRLQAAVPGVDVNEPGSEDDGRLRVKDVNEPVTEHNCRLRVNGCQTAILIL